RGSARLAHLALDQAAASEVLDRVEDGLLDRAEARAELAARLVVAIEARPEAVLEEGAREQRRLAGAAGVELHRAGDGPRDADRELDQGPPGAAGVEDRADELFVGEVVG